MADSGPTVKRIAHGGRAVVASARRQLDLRRAARGERSAHRIRPDLPFTIRLDHPPTADASPRYGYGRPAHPGLAAVLGSSEERYRAELTHFAEFFDDVARFPLHGPDRVDPCWVNNWLIGLDILSIYSFTRLRRPVRYVEVGSGQSTKVVARARRDGGLATRITSIDPAPRSEVDSLCDRIVRSPLEQVDLEEHFGGLEPGDMVFFDGSHRVLPNSDCVAFFLDVLPSLSAGVLVGIHDIYLPDDYPPEFISLWWSEQYVLAAFLLGTSPAFDVILPNLYASGRPELASLLDPLFGRPELSAVNRRGSAFWLQVR